MSSVHNSKLSVVSKSCTLGLVWLGHFFNIVNVALKEHPQHRNECLIRILILLFSIVLSCFGLHLDTPL